ARHQQSASEFRLRAVQLSQKDTKGTQKDTKGTQRVQRTQRRGISLMSSFAFTWLGHATFLFQSPGGRRIVLDPWITGNPSSPESAKKLGALDLILISHGHSDHAGDAVALARSSGAHAVAPYAVSVWLQGTGLQRVTGMHPGGTLNLLGLSITMVPAIHSSSVTDEGKTLYIGGATGYVIRLEN